VLSARRSEFIPRSPWTLHVQTLTSYLRRIASNCLWPLAQRAARGYIAGPELGDALRVADQLGGRGYGSTVGFWDGEGDSARSVADQYLAALEALAVGRAEHFSVDGLDTYLSIKLPALQFSAELLGEVAERAARRQVRLHFDSHGPETADATWQAIVALAGGGPELSSTLPGRWRRSLDDAELAIAHGVTVRVVKGQWSDIEQPEIDLREGFLNVIDQLAGRARHVAVASHDAPLAAEALRRLRASGTSCELELLYGLPQRAALDVAVELDVPVRFYVPYGRAYLPYCLAQARRQPRLIWWLLRDSLVPRRGAGFQGAIHTPRSHSASTHGAGTPNAYSVAPQPR
jgi:proline dehydrogenase